MRNFTKTAEANSPIQLRELARDEMGRTDAIYEAVRFARTDPECTRMIAAWAGERLVGIGRVLDLGVYEGRRIRELGGMWVHPSFRKQGIASRIIRELKAWIPAGDELWCTPFADLMCVYGPHGFVEVPRQNAPAPVLARLALCTSSQARDVCVTRL